jgi:hypothetical protein
MEKIVVSAKYKGDTKLFTHGKSYLISVSQKSDGQVDVVNLKTSGNNYFYQSPEENYETIISFLTHWDEITSYPSLSISDSR